MLGGDAISKIVNLELVEVITVFGNSGRAPSCQTECPVRMKIFSLTENSISDGTYRRLTRRVGLSVPSPRRAFCEKRFSSAVGFPLLSLTQKKRNIEFRMMNIQYRSILALFHFNILTSKFIIRYSKNISRKMKSPPTNKIS